MFNDITEYCDKYRTLAHVDTWTKEQLADMFNHKVSTIKVKTPYGEGVISGRGQNGTGAAAEYNLVVRLENGKQAIFRSSTGKWSNEEEDAQASWTKQWSEMPELTREFIELIVPNWNTLSKASKKYEPHKLKILALNRAIRKGIVEAKVCGRCGGTGKHSYNQIHGDVCYGCGGSGKVYPAITRTILNAAKTIDWKSINWVEEDRTRKEDQQRKVEEAAKKAELHKQELNAKRARELADKKEAEDAAMAEMRDKAAKEVDQAYLRIKSKAVNGKFVMGKDQAEWLTTRILKMGKDRRTLRSIELTGEGTIKGANFEYDPEPDSQGQVVIAFR